MLILPHLRHWFLSLWSCCMAFVFRFIVYLWEQQLMHDVTSLTPQRVVGRRLPPPHAVTVSVRTAVLFRSRRLGRDRRSFRRVVFLVVSRCVRTVWNWQQPSVSWRRARQPCSLRTTRPATRPCMAPAATAP